MAYSGREVQKVSPYKKQLYSKAVYLLMVNALRGFKKIILNMEFTISPEVDLSARLADAHSLRGINLVSIRVHSRCTYSLSLARMSLVTTTYTHQYDIFPG